MDAAAYDTLRADQSHWWFRGRRAVIKTALDRLDLPANLKIAEAGCGAGGNLPLLSTYGTVTGVEPNPDIAAYARENQPNAVHNGALPDNWPIRTKSDLIAALDVLEHIEDDANALAALYGTLNRHGRLLLTVPADPALWSHHDTHHGHHRRYERATLNKMLDDMGYDVEYSTYFNTLLYPLIRLARIIKSSTRSKTSDGAQPPKAINTILENIMRLEAFLLRHITFPFGVSLLVIARRREPPPATGLSSLIRAFDWHLL